MPTGVADATHPPLNPTRPGMLLVCDGALMRLAPDPKGAAEPQLMLMLAVWATRSFAFQPEMALLASGEVSPKPGARKLLPQEAWKVTPASSDGIQSAEIFGLEVPP